MWKKEKKQETQEVSPEKEEGRDLYEWAQALVCSVLAVVLLAWSGAFGGPLTAAMELVLRGLCRVVQFPFALVEYYFF